MGVVSDIWSGGRLHAPMHTFQKTGSKSSVSHERRGLRQCGENAPFRHTGQKHATLSPLFRSAKIFRQGVDIVLVIGDYWGVVNEQVDAQKEIPDLDTRQDHDQLEC